MQIVLKYINQKNFWVLLILCLTFFLLRFPSLFEPNWYGDEGIYQSIGYSLRSGRQFYTGVWDNKPPLLFVIYAIASGDQFYARLISLLFGLAAIMTFYSLSKKIFDKTKPQVISTLFFSLLFGLPIIEGNIANSENFMLLPMLLSANILYPTVFNLDGKLNSNNKRRLIIAGLILSSSFLIKIVSIFDFAAFLSFSFFTLTYSKYISVKSLLKIIIKYIHKIGWFVLGFILPVILSVIFFHFLDVLPYYLDAAFGRNIDYVGWGNYFIIPQGLLYIRLVILGVFILGLFVKREFFAKSTLFILIWLAFSLFNGFFSNRGYTHYQLLILPSFSLLIGLIFRKQTQKKTFRIISFTVLILMIVYFNFGHWGIGRTINYYGNYISLLFGKKDYESYQKFFDPRNPKDYAIATYIKNHTNPQDVVFLWGNSAHIYPLSKTLPPGRYSAAYHIGANRKNIDETEKALIKNKPKYIIITQDLSYFPFDLSGYDYRITIEDSHIYEHHHE